MVATSRRRVAYSVCSERSSILECDLVEKSMACFETRIKIPSKEIDTDGSNPIQNGAEKCSSARTSCASACCSRRACVCSLRNPSKRVDAGSGERRAPADGQALFRCAGPGEHDMILIPSTLTGGRPRRLQRWRARGPPPRHFSIRRVGRILLFGTLLCSGVGTREAYLPPLAARTCSMLNE